MHIELDGVSLSYGSDQALVGVSASLPAKRIYGLIGRNGSGKTSLLSILAGFRRPSAGTVLVDGADPFEDVDRMARACFIREVGSDEPNNRLGRALDVAGALRPTWDHDYALDLSDRFGLPLDKRIRNMSRGQRSAVGVVVGLASRTDLTIFDEAHLGMDVPSRYSFYEAALEDYMAHPRTVIISTHLVEEAASVFESVLVLHQGTVLLHDDADAIRERGVAVTGPSPAVEAFTDGLTVLNRQSLGPTASVAVYGELGDAKRQEAAELGLELGPIALQDLFVHLTGQGAAR